MVYQGVMRNKLLSPEAKALLKDYEMRNIEYGKQKNVLSGRG